MKKVRNARQKVYPERSRRVFVGLSGGVDSSVSAALLKEAGFDVTGVFIKVWQPFDSPDFAHGKPQYQCNWKNDRLDAMRVCATLGIPFLTLDLEKEYKQSVVDYMIAEYKAGRTPNPDVMCNKHVKFGAFFNWAIKNGADYVATGHYAQIKEKKDGTFGLHVAEDKNKDQSYFLWTLGQGELAHTLFPVGGLKKPKVRKLAKQFGLITYNKKDSQGLCFIGKVSMKEFLSHFIKEKKGIVYDEKGAIIGTHNGAFFFTIGERHGFTVTKKTPYDKPYYVVGKDIKKNVLIVSHNMSVVETDKELKTVKIIQTQWQHGAPAIGKKIEVRFRYRQKLEKVTMTHIAKDTATILFDTSQYLPDGQSLVLYQGGECLGGGILRQD